MGKLPDGNPDSTNLAQTSQKRPPVVVLAGKTIGFTGLQSIHFENS